MNTFLIIIVCVIVLPIIIILLWIGGAYNGLVTLRNRVNNGWAQIDVQLKRRYDLIPNLVETVKGYASHEKGVFEAVTQARANAISAGSVGEQGQAENQLSQSLRSLFAVAEAYPELKANENFLNLQNQLAEAENKIGYARQFYNDVVMKYNTSRETFPNVLISNAMGFTQKDYFELDNAQERSAPTVKF